MDHDISDQDAMDVLSLEPGYSLQQLKARYRAVALRVHPDRGGSPSLFQTVVDCYSVLLEAYYARTGSRTHFDLKGAHEEHGERAADRAAGRIEPGEGDEFSERFNSAFEATRVSDPVDDGGYGEWLRDQAGGGEPPALGPGCLKSPETFNRQFETHVPVRPEEMSLAVRPAAAGGGGGSLAYSELGLAEVDDYGVAVSGSIEACDCKKAYSNERIASACAEQAPLSAFNTGKIFSERAADLERGLAASEVAAQRRREHKELEKERAREYAAQQYQRQHDRMRFEAFANANRLLLK